jgi:SAM-dependent methyltransferase
VIGSEPGSERCELCGARARQWCRARGYSFFVCRECDYAFVPRSESGHLTADAVFGNDYFFGGGPGYPNYLLEADLLRAQGRRYGVLLAKFAKPGRILDVGAAAGFVLSGLVQSGWSGVGLEPNQTMTAHARESEGVDVRVGTLERAELGATFDAVSMIQVIDHVVDLGQAIEQVTRVLAPGGLLLVETWDRGSATARLFGKHWHEYSPPSVLRVFSRRALRRCLVKRGFEFIAQGRSKKYVRVGHAKALFAFKAGQSRVARSFIRLIDAIPDRLTLRYPADDLFWAIYRRERSFVGAKTPA